MKVSELITLLQGARQEDEVLVAYPAMDANGEEFIEYCEFSGSIIPSKLYTDCTLPVTPIIPPDSHNIILMGGEED